MSLRQVVTDGIITLEECDWGFIDAERRMRFRQSDLWMLSDRFNNLTTEQQTELTTYRQALRDITDYDTANDAADNFPTLPDWMN
jgi:hypothetical protein